MPKKKETKKELTRVITAKITIIEKIDEHKKASKEEVADMLKRKIGADHVTVSKVDDFVLGD